MDSFTAPDLTKAIEKLNNENRFKIILDLSKLEYMSSAGFRSMLLGQRNCKRYNRGEIVLACVPKKVMDALELTGFILIFDEITPAVGNLNTILANIKLRPPPSFQL